MNSKQPSFALQKDLLLFGSVLVIIGIFLPWEVEGDFLANWRYGIQIYPTFVDNGGIVLLLLSMGIILFVPRLEKFRRYVTKSILMSAVFLFVICVYHILDWLVRRVSAEGIVGAPTIRIGLILVGIGSVITLVTAFYLRSTESEGNAEVRESPPVVSTKSR